jgi:putative ABC transport system permease protein
MNAIVAAALADLRRRKLQTFIIALVVLLTSGAATLALSLLVETDAPYDHAFARANGAHLTIVYQANAVSTATLRHTASAPGVAATAGPWPEVLSLYSHTGPDGGKAIQGLTLVGRSRPDTAVDRLTLEAGRWTRAPGEIVASRHLADAWGLRLGDTVSPAPGTDGPTLHVVGIAASISPYTDGWIVPSQIPAVFSGQNSSLDQMLHRGMPAGASLEQMLYRVAPAGTDAQLRAATQAITAHVPHGAVQSVGSYLDVKRNADIVAAVMVPFLLAFSVFALVASGLIIGNVVGGAVVSSYRDIGVMRAVGFTPAGVIAVLLLQILVPALAGCVGGIVLGTLVSQPFLSDTAHALGLPSTFTAAPQVDLGVVVVLALVVIAAAFLPARRAGTMSAVAAITLGSAPPRSGSSRFSRFALGLSLPRPLALGLADAVSRPLRSVMTLGAIITGVATVIFAFSLHLSLGLVAEHVDRDQYAQVDVYPISAAGPGAIKGGALPPGFPPPVTAAHAATILRNDPGTAHFVAEGQSDIMVPGISEPIPYIAYRGPSAWTGYAMISGRWFTRPGEVVAPTKLLSQAHLRVGQTLTAYRAGHPMRLTIVGEVFDQSYGDLFLRGTWSTLAAAGPPLAVQQFEVQVRSGSDLAAYVKRVQRPSLPVNLARQAGSETSFILINGVIAGLALVLILIATAGVFNTVLLNTREQLRDIAILKAVGMDPRSVVGMVVTSVALLGVIAGGIGIPVGLVLHRNILSFMGKIASGTNIPPSFFDPISHIMYPLLLLSGAFIAVIGAWLPAQWAASSGVSDVLSRE